MANRCVKPTEFDKQRIIFHVKVPKNKKKDVRKNMAEGLEAHLRCVYKAQLEQYVLNLNIN